MSPTAEGELANLQQTIGELRRQLAERTAQLDEALARETATAEVLGVINSSPGNLDPVFDAILVWRPSSAGTSTSLSIDDVRGGNLPRIFRFARHGADWRRANAGHVSRAQLQVMSATEQCRAAGLGSSGYARAYDIIDAKLFALRQCERRSPLPVCTLVWCRPGGPRIISTAPVTDMPRQGSPTGRTLLMSPAMVAAAAINGAVADVREMM